MHCEPLVEHRPQIGCSLLHLTFEAAQASQEARSFGLRSLSDLDLGAEVGTEVGAEVGALSEVRGIGGLEIGCSSCIDGCHGAGGDEVKDMLVATAMGSRSSNRG
jgi:hypothetical protein